MCYWDGIAGNDYFEAITVNDDNSLVNGSTEMTGTQKMQIYGNRKLGLWFGQRVNSMWSWLIALMIVIGSIRGVIVLNSELPANTVYVTTASALLMLATYGFIISERYKNHELTLLKKLLITNFFLGGLNIVVDLFFGIPFQPGLLYCYLAPYVIFLLLRVPTFYLNVVFYVIAIAISYSVCDNYFEILQGSEGYERVFAYNLKLRPEIFEAFSRTGEFVRVGGYTGSYHDSANILGMMVSFFFIRFLLKHKMLDFGICLVAMLSLMLTQSATNIMAAIITIVIFSSYILYRNFKASTLIFLLLGLSGVIVLSAIYGDVMGAFLLRVGADGDWEGMRNKLDMSSILSAVPFILVGHAMGFGSEVNRTEIGYLKDLYQLGIVHAAVFYLILLYPVFRFIKVRLLCSDALPYVAAIFFGFMSLFHYGSLLRVTNVFLFFSFYAIGLNNIICCRNFMRISDSLRHGSVAEKHCEP